MKYLIVIDVQNDFVSGALGTPEARRMLPRLAARARAFDGTLLLTQDTHGPDYLETQEGRMLPVPHCIRGTEGWALSAELEAARQAKGAKVYEKSCFGSASLAKDLAAACAGGGVESVELAGLCTDICVIVNALLIKTALPDLPVLVDASCCAGVTPQKHAAALEVMESCQVIVRR